MPGIRGLQQNVDSSRGLGKKVEESSRTEVTKQTRGEEVEEVP
jgi:hypothetical protein